MLSRNNPEINCHGWIAQSHLKHQFQFFFFVIFINFSTLFFFWKIHVGICKVILLINGSFYSTSISLFLWTWELRVNFKAMVVWAMKQTVFFTLNLLTFWKWIKRKFQVKAKRWCCITLRFPIKNLFERKKKSSTAAPKYTELWGNKQ